MVKICAITTNKCIGDIESNELCDTCEVALLKDKFVKSFEMGKNAYYKRIHTPHVDPEMYEIHENLTPRMVSMLRNKWFKGYNAEMNINLINIK